MFTKKLLILFSLANINNQIAASFGCCSSPKSSPNNRNRPTRLTIEAGNVSATINSRSLDAAPNPTPYLQMQASEKCPIGSFCLILLLSK